MRKFLLSATVVVGFLIYALHLKSSGAETNPVVAPKTSTPSLTVNGQSVTTTQPSNGSSNNNSQPAPTTGAYKDGSYTGSVADAYYGNVQVKAVISGGKITDVQFLQYPNDRQNSILINSQAMPILTQEAIQVQSAQVDIVSGATETSMAFQQSLTDALTQAH